MLMKIVHLNVIMKMFLDRVLYNLIEHHFHYWLNYHQYHLFDYIDKIQLMHVQHYHVDLVMVIMLEELQLEIRDVLLLKQNLWTMWCEYHLMIEVTMLIVALYSVKLHVVLDVNFDVVLVVFERTDLNLYKHILLIQHYRILFYKHFVD